MKIMQSPSQTVGPFFDFGLFTSGDENMLVNDHTRGERIYVKGQVLDGDGNPVTDAMLEIWQPDADGYFHHPADSNHEKADKNFRGFGRADTVNNGQFTFKTIKPGAVTWDGHTMQARHINVRIFARGMLTHAYTRLYFSDESAANASDPVLKLVEAARRSTLIAQREEAGDLPTYCFDVVLQGDRETVFFNP